MIDRDVILYLNFMKFNIDSYNPLFPQRVYPSSIFSIIILV